jgi:hypothetical protein
MSEVSEQRNLKRWLRWISKGFLVPAGLACAVLVVAVVLLGTVFPAQRGCEECGTHVTLVILTVLSIGVAMICVVLAAAIALISTWL